MTETPMEVPTRDRSGALRLVAAFPVALFAAACGGGDGDGTGPTPPPPPPDISCVTEFPDRFLADGGVGRCGIPALGACAAAEPQFAPVGSDALGFIRDHDRVVGFFLDGQAYAIPHNILWWHEIVNADIGGRRLAISFCPITGTPLGFDLTSIGGDFLQTSGLLFQANLVMAQYRGTAQNDSELLISQMLGEAVCARGNETANLGLQLDRFPLVEMRWDRWRQIHPNSMVVTDQTGVPRNYQQNPYGANFSFLDDGQFLDFPMPRYSATFQPTELVLGIPPAGSEAGISFASGRLAEAPGQTALVEFTWQGEPALLVWDQRGEGGSAFRTRTRTGTPVDLTTDGQQFVDGNTGSVFLESGMAVSGPLEGELLEPITSAYMAFWGAWDAFFPDAVVWEG